MSISKSFTRERSEAAIQSFIRNIREKRTVYAEFMGREEKCESIQDALDYILDSLRIIKNRNFTIIDIETYYGLEINEIADEYGFEAVYLTANPGNFHNTDYKLILTVVVADKRYTSGFLSKLKYLYKWIS